MKEKDLDIPPPSFANFQDFNTASTQALSYLKDKYDFGLWMVTRTVDNYWIVVKALSSKYPVADGDVFNWDDSFCYHMVRGDGPHIAPDSDQVAVYKNAPIGQEVPIKAYIGYPLHKKDGSLFGTLCAIDPETKSPALIQDEATLGRIAKELSAVMNGERNAKDLQATLSLLDVRSVEDGDPGDDAPAPNAPNAPEGP